MAGRTGNQPIARRYALAFFALAHDQGQVAAVAQDMGGLARMLAESPDFRKFIDNAALVRVADQLKVLAAIGDKAKFNALTQKFLGTLATKRRLSLLAETVGAVQGEIARHKGEITATVTAVQALDSAQVGEIAAALKKTLGLEVKVELKLDPAIMGGLIIQVGSRRIDSSVRSKLDRLHRALKNSSTSSDKTKIREVA